jgi:hypothetical protein
MGAIERLLAEHPEVPGIEDQSGSALLFAPDEADYVAAAAAMGIEDPRGTAIRCTVAEMGSK